MKLKVKHLHIFSEGPLIAVMHKSDAILIGARALNRVLLTFGRKKEKVILDTTTTRELVKPGEIGLFGDVLRKFRVRKGVFIDVDLAALPHSLHHIKRKLDGENLVPIEIDHIIKDLVEDNLTDIEATYFVSGCYINKMSLEESAALTRAIVKYGGTIKFKKKVIVDKHCIGGVPGNRTTPIIVPILAAAGLTIPKTSTRSITSPSGTADTVEVFMDVTHSRDKIKKIVEKTGACMVWGGAVGLASADDKLINLERPLSLDPEGILLASILAKKVAIGSTHVLIDIPVGDEAKIVSVKKAKILAKHFVDLGKKLNLKIDTMISSGKEPIGNGIGPALEARDVLLVLNGVGPKDLKVKSLKMAARIMEMSGIKDPYKKAKEILESGKAYEKMREIIKMQGGNPKITPEKIKLGKFKCQIRTNCFGTVVNISLKQISRIAKYAGAAQDKGAGIYLNRKLGNLVEKKDVLYTIYSNSKEHLNVAKKLAMKNNAFKLSCE